MSRSDVSIIKGMGAIVNKDNIRPGIDMSDLKALEQRMAAGGLIQKKIVDPADRLHEDLADAASKLGIDFGEFTKPKQKDAINKWPMSAHIPPNINASRSQPLTLESSGYTSDYKAESTYSPKYESSSSSNSNSGSESEDGEEEEEEPAESTSGYNSGGYAPSTNRFDSGSDFQPNRFSDSGSNYRSDTNRFDTRTDSSRPRFGGDIDHRTREQERRSHIDAVMGVSQEQGTHDFSFEREKREDRKCEMLGEIDNLINTLSNYDVNLDRIPKVDQTTDYATVETVLKMLRYKNDNARYCDFAEEFLLFGAYALEELFDGKRMWFNRYQPDLTGWHNNVNVKLKRMRHDTGQLVSGVMQDYNIGPGTRILMELVPNLVLYSKMKKQQHSHSGYDIDDGEVERATHNIRNLNGD